MDVEKQWWESCTVARYGNATVKLAGKAGSSNSGRMMMMYYV